MREGELPVQASSKVGLSAMFAVTIFLWIFSKSAANFVA
jgi:hypothetical protein